MYMKTKFTWKCLTRSLLLSIVLWGLAGATVSLAAATVSVSPSTITSTTQTDVQVTISGLTNGGIIRLEKWIDTNQNGYQDSSDILWTRKRLQDGEHPANASQPGDEDGIANGQIVTNINYSTITNSIRDHLSCL